MERFKWFAAAELTGIGMFRRTDPVFSRAG